MTNSVWETGEHDECRAARRLSSGTWETSTRVRPRLVLPAANVATEAAADLQLDRSLKPIGTKTPDQKRSRLIRRQMPQLGAERACEEVT